MYSMFNGYKRARRLHEAHQGHSAELGVGVVFCVQICTCSLLLFHFYLVFDNRCQFEKNYIIKSVETSKIMPLSFVEMSWIYNGQFSRTFFNGSVVQCKFSVSVLVNSGCWLAKSVRIIYLWCKFKIYIYNLGKWFIRH